MICPNCNRRITMKANRRKIRGVYIHKRCNKNNKIRKREK